MSPYHREFVEPCHLAEIFVLCNATVSVFCQYMWLRPRDVYSDCEGNPRISLAPKTKKLPPKSIPVYSRETSKVELPSFSNASDSVLSLSNSGDLISSFLESSHVVFIHNPRIPFAHSFEAILPFAQYLISKMSKPFSYSSKIEFPSPFTNPAKLPLLEF